MYLVARLSQAVHIKARSRRDSSLFPLGIRPEQTCSPSERDSESVGRQPHPLCEFGVVYLNSGDTEITEHTGN